MARPPLKRPILPKEERARLRAMASRAARSIEDGSPTRTYAQAVVDTLLWVTGDDVEMSPLLEEVTR